MSFPTEFHPPQSEDNLFDVREHVARLEQEHRSRGLQLSGRIIHVVHYLPIVSTLKVKQEDPLISPPATPEADIVALETIKSKARPAEQQLSAHEDDAVDPLSSHLSPPLSGPAAVLSPAISTTSLTDLTASDPDSKWHLTPRRGHTAMVSGIRSLCDTHEQVILAWTGDVEVGVPGITSAHRESVKIANLTSEDRASLEDAISKYVAPEDVGANRKKMSYVPVWLDDKVAHGHYEGYCKTVLWPLFHYLLWQDVATEVPSEKQHWDAYLKANEAFAAKLAAVWQPGDLIWIHDYHWLMLPKLFRNFSKNTQDAFIGLFVHTPFPSSEVFRCLPRRRDVLDGMLGSNLVVFQKYSYARHFASSCVRVCGYETAPGGIDVAGQVTSIQYCAVGVDADRVSKDTLRPGIKPKLETLRALYQGKKIIVGRDKLDVVKGVPQKLRAFEKLLKDYPQWRGKVVLIQVTSPSLTDAPKLERQVSELVAHINGEFGSLDFIPVHHYHQTIKKDDFYALLSVADLALITPLRDGMNTTSMEYVICQQKTNKAPLVLSEFMGISTTMANALQINPWDLGGVAAVINQGLLMSEEEKELRHSALYKTVTTHTSHLWAISLVKMLLSQIGSENTAHQTPYMDTALLAEQYHSAKKRLLLFDYDGTLTPIVKTPSAAVPSAATLEALQKLSEDPKNLVYIISGRDGEFLEQHLGHLSNVGFSAEHGSFVRAPGQKEWSNLTETLDMSWMPEVEELFDYYTERTTGSFIELKKSSITWHYRASDPEWGSFQCKQCLDLLENNLVPKRPIEVLVGKKNLEVRPIAVNKGEIVKRLVYNNPDAEFIFCAGDDKTDEDMFRALCTLYPVGATTAVMNPPVSASLVASNGTPPPTEPRTLAIQPKGLFATTVGQSSKKTLAAWHVTTPHEIVDAMLKLVGSDTIYTPSNAPAL